MYEDPDRRQLTRLGSALFRRSFIAQGRADAFQFAIQCDGNLASLGAEIREHEDQIAESLANRINGPLSLGASPRIYRDAYIAALKEAAEIVRRLSASALLLFRLPRLVLPNDFSERDAARIRDEGRYSATVETSKGWRYLVSFFDRTRLAQEVSNSLLRGEVCFVEPGLVVVPEVTIEAMQHALAHLAEADYFKRLTPIGPS